MSVRTKADKAAVANLRMLLDVKDPAFCGSEKIKAAFSDLDVRLYLQSWVLPELDSLSPQAKVQS